MLGFGWLGFSDGVPAWPVSLEIGEISRFPAWLFLSQFYKFCENRVCIGQNAMVFMTTSFAWNHVAHGAQIGRSQNIRKFRQHMAKRKGFHEIYLGGCWGELLLIWQGCPWGPGFQKSRKKTVVGALHFTVGRFFGLLGFGCLGFSDGVPAWPVSVEIGEIMRFPAWLFLSPF